MEKVRYYLNNFSDKIMKITLSTQREIKPLSSLPLNVKDIMMFKKLKDARRGKASMLDNLKLSTIPIEKDANYLAMKNKLEVKANEELNNGENDEVKDFLDGVTNKTPDGTSNISEEEAAKLEVEAMMQLEQKAKEEAEAIVKEKAKIAKNLQKDAAKDGKTYTEEDLAKAVEEAYAEAHKEN